MFHLHRDMTFWFYPHPTDMRKSFYTLCGIVTNAMGRNVRDGEVFIFVNRDRNCLKILHLECGGLVLYHMRLETGCFKLPVFDPQSQSFHFSWEDLMLMVQHRELITHRKKARKKASE